MLTLALTSMIIKIQGALDSFGNHLYGNISAKKPEEDA